MFPPKTFRGRMDDCAGMVQKAHQARRVDHGIFMAASNFDILDPKAELGR